MSTINYLALGDSYTIGEQVQYEENLPHHLANYLQEKHPNKEINIEVLATTGWTTDELIDAMKKHNFKASYDYISLLIGVNNQYRKLPIEQYHEELIYLFDWIKSKVSQPENVLIISIPDWGQSPFGLKSDKHPESELVTQEIIEYNQFAEENAAKYQFQYYSIFELSQQQGLTKDGETYPYITPDLLHYSSKAYKEWADIAHWNFKDV